MQDLPTGEVTLLFTDIEGSTRLLEYLGEDAYGLVLGAHHRAVRHAVAVNDGIEVSTEGDAFFVVFRRAADAARAALDAQLALGQQRWPDGAPVRVRMGLHTGQVRLGGDNYIGLTVHEGARIAATAHGGQIVASRSTLKAAGALRDGASWRPLGSHRLSDLVHPIELFQLCGDGVADSHPPLRSLDRIVHNLPVQQSSFLGRRDELLEGARLLDGTRLLSIIGPGGTGKSRLGYQLAAEQLDAFPDGTWVAELAPVRDPELVAGTLLTALGLRDEPGRIATQTIVAHLMTRRALVILDNCEHLVDAAAALASALLVGCSGVKVLATSRTPLRVTGEAVWSLLPMSLLPSGASAPGTSTLSDAVSLFAERAAEATADFALTASNAPIVTGICNRLEGIPLAIELAAARVRTVPLETIASRLEDSFDLLSKGSRGAPDRQSSLNATIRWSHDLLDAMERVLFRRLSVFAGGLSLDAAELVCAFEPLPAERVLETMDGLVDKSLVSFHPGEAGAARFGLLETIRTYALERAGEANESDALRRHHGMYFSQMASSCAADLDTQGAMDRLEADHANLLAALESFRDADHSAEHGRLTFDLSEFWKLRGHWQLAHRELLAYVDRRDAIPALAGRCFTMLSDVTIDLGKWDEGRKYMEEALNISRSLGDQVLEAESLLELAQLDQKQGEFMGSQARFEECLQVALSIDDRLMEARVLNGLGAVFGCTSRYEEARNLMERALLIARELGDRRLQCTLLGNLGNIHSELGDYEQASERYLAAIEISDELGDRRSECQWIGGLGSLTARRGRIVEAQRLLQRAFDIARDLGYPALHAWCAGQLGILSMRLGEFDVAGDRLNEALTIAQDLGDRVTEVWWVASLGALALMQGEHAEARSRYTAALEIARDVGDRRSESEHLGFLGEIFCQTGELDHASAHLEDALRIAVEVGDPRLVGNWERGLGDVAIEQDDLVAAAGRYGRALEVARGLDDYNAELLEACATALVELGDLEAAGIVLVLADQHRRDHGLARSAWEQDRFQRNVAACRSATGGSRDAGPPAAEGGEWAFAVAITADRLATHHSAP